MAIRFIRQPSNTPNILNSDDVRMIKYAYGGQDGFVQNSGDELSYTVIGSLFRINSGVVVLQGWESEIDSNGWAITVDNVATKRYYSIYYEVNLAVQAVSIKSVYDTAGYPEVSRGDNLESIKTGKSCLLLYRFTAINGVISDVAKLVQKILHIKQDENGVLKIGDTVIPQRIKIFDIQDGLVPPIRIQSINSPIYVNMGKDVLGKTLDIEFSAYPLDKELFKGDLSLQKMHAIITVPTEKYESTGNVHDTELYRCSEISSRRVNIDLDISSGTHIYVYDKITENVLIVWAPLNKTTLLHDALAFELKGTCTTGDKNASILKYIAICSVYEIIE